MAGKGSNDFDGSGLLFVAVLLIIGLPILGFYWAFAGDNEIKRIIGWILIVIVIFGSIFK